MQPKTEEFLYFLLWSIDHFYHPTFRNLTESYESWAYRHGLGRQLSELTKRRLLDTQTSAHGDRVYRLTTKGFLHALGGRDPEARWSRDWDGRWRLVSFDVPNTHNSHRARLRNYLQGRGFGHLQNSVWITPDPLEEERRVLVGGKIDVKSLILLEARPCAGESDGEIVAGGWNFASINRRYARHLKIIKERPDGALHNETAAKELRCWAAEEREAWLDAVTSDPLLPERLLPSGYLGCQSWKQRIQSLRQAGRLLRTFTT